jgi:D-arabinose 1-dehydrogenase-like Zn-dependent alcohol dehydrogenase
LLNRKSEFNVTALVRNAENAKKVEQLGAKAVIGDNDSTELLTSTASKNDIVIHTADASDHLNSAKALIAGLKLRKTDGPLARPIYIHTSGSCTHQLFPPNF